MKEVLAASCVTDPYHFDTDPDSGCEEIRYGSGSRKNFDTDPDPGKTIRIRIPNPANFLYGFGSKKMIRILRIRIRNTGPGSVETYFMNRDKALLVDTIKRDTAFLALHHMMDYSLLAGICR